MSFFIVLGIALWILFAFWPALVAKSKGYSFFLFLILSWAVSFLVTLIVVLLLEDKTATASTRAADKAAEDALDKDESRA